MSVEQSLQAEVSSIFEVDKAKGELYFRLARGPGSDKVKSLRLPIGKGIARCGGSDGKAVGVDPYRDTRFSPQFDAESGFHTRSILSVPLKSKGPAHGGAGSA